MTLNFSSTRSCSAPQSGRHRQSWDKSDRRTLRRKGPAFYDPNSPAVFPPGTLVVSEGTEGQGAHKTFASGRELSTAKHNPPTSSGCKVPQKDRTLLWSQHWRTSAGLKQCCKQAKGLCGCSGERDVSKGWQQHRPHVTAVHRAAPGSKL